MQQIEAICNSISFNCIFFKHEAIKVAAHESTHSVLLGGAPSFWKGLPHQAQ